MAAPTFSEAVILNSTGGAQNIGAAGALTSNSIRCRGAKAVHFLVYSTSDVDVFAASGAFNARVIVDEGTAAIEGTAAGSFATTGNLNAAAGTGGGCITLTPVGGPDVRIGAYAVGCRVVAGANAIDNVLIKAIVVW